MSPEHASSPHQAAEARATAPRGLDAELRAPGGIGKALVVVDTLVIAVAAGSAVVAAHAGGHGPEPRNAWIWPAAVPLCTLWLILLWHQQSRAALVLGYGAEEYRRVLVASAWAVTIAAALAYFLGTTA
ncbi:MAG: hypothetical protein RLZ55_1655, partial [Actinomycetota bacterium]